MLQWYGSLSEGLSTDTLLIFYMNVWLSTAGIVIVHTEYCLLAMWFGSIFWSFFGVFYFQLVTQKVSGIYCVYFFYCLIYITQTHQFTGVALLCLAVQQYTWEFWYSTLIKVELKILKSKFGKVQFWKIKCVIFHSSNPQQASSFQSLF